MYFVVAAAVAVVVVSVVVNSGDAIFRCSFFDSCLSTSSLTRGYKTQTVHFLGRRIAICMLISHLNYLYNYNDFLTLDKLQFICYYVT